MSLTTLTQQFPNLVASGLVSIKGDASSDGRIYKTTPEQRDESRKYYRDNLDQQRATTKRWQKDNRDYHLAYLRAYGYAERRGLPFRWNSHKRVNEAIL